MSPEDVKALRLRLRATSKDLAHALDIEPATVVAWERGEEFPTKRFVDALSKLDEKGPDAFPRLPSKRAKKQADAVTLLADPEVWRLFRKILAYPELREAVSKLADAHDDPAS